MVYAIIYTLFLVSRLSNDAAATAIPPFLGLWFDNRLRFLPSD